MASGERPVDRGSSRRVGSVRLLTPPVLALVALALASCGGGSSGVPASAARSGSFEATKAEARGQEVRWWMFGGDARVNAYVDDHVAPAARRLGVRLRRVPVSDTADAVQRVVAQRRAGADSGGAVDLIWINGENFAAGKSAGLWLEDWVPRLPNARYLDLRDPTIARDFQVPVDGQEAPWSRAVFVYAHDSANVPDPPRTFDELLEWARRHPGRFTYPAPPDFTGSAFVRQVVVAKGEDAAFSYLRRLKPLMYRKGRALPKSEAELNELFADGQVDFAMSYDASFVLGGVRRGQFARAVRPFLLEGGALTNVSFVAIPADAEHLAGAQVVANLLLSPELQAAKADPAILGHPTVLDPARLEADSRDRFRHATSSPYLLSDFGEAREELPAAEVPRLERRWQQEVLRG
jgi:putative spermidine/putrescine transport system substrate-binding protein